MKLIFRIVLVGLVSLNIAVTFQGASASAATTISVATYDAKCDGVTDDRAAIQSALNAAAAAGGGTVTLPGSTCLLNSFEPEIHPWHFYNLKIPSSVTLQGTTGSKLLQGPGGRQLISKIPGAQWVANLVVLAGNQCSYNSFQVGPFYNLEAMTVASPTVTLQTPSQSSIFKAGDYVSIFEYTTGDVLPGQITQVTQVNAATGELTLLDPVIRAFQKPWIANVTSTAAHDTAINGVIVQGAIPLAVNETFGFHASNNEFLSDTSIGGGNFYEVLLNYAEHFNFTNNVFAPAAGSYYFAQELGQRDSQNGVWDGNTFRVAAVGFGEYAANITMTNNHIFLHVDPNIVAGVAMGGQNVVFKGNDVHTLGNNTGGQGWGFIVTDVYAPAYYYAYTGNIQITNNTIQCVADGNNCLLLESYGAVASGNTITATGFATGINAVSSAQITNNTINIGSGTGILLQPWANAATVAGNTLSGTGPFGIYVADPPTPASGLLIQNNTMQGFATPLSINLSLQPGAILSNNH
jgi:hypothetical protein